MKYKKLQIFLTSFLYLCFSFSVNAGKIEKGFISLKSLNYFEAKSLFEKSFKGYPAVSSYGLSLIYFHSDYPYHNIDSAYKHINNAITFLSTGDLKELEKFKKLSVTQDSLLSVRKAIINSAYSKATSSEKVSLMNHFIEFYNNEPEAGAVLRLRDSLAFETTRKSNNSESYQQFMIQYPASHLYIEANARFEKTLYEESVFNGIESSYINFIKAYPNSPYVNEAVQRIFELSTHNSNDATIYYNFLNKYPSGLMTEIAWQHIYDITVTDYNESSLLKFKSLYPDYPYMEKLEEDIKLSRVTLLQHKENGKVGLINTEGVAVTGAVYDYIGEFCNGIAVISLDSKMGYIWKSGEEIIPPFYEQAKDFHNNLAIVGDGKNFGVINRSGKMIVPLNFSQISDFSDGLAAASNGSRYGYISRSGKTVIPFTYQAAGDFNNGLAICQDDVFYGVINTTGEEVVSFKYEFVERFDSVTFKFRINKHSGLVSDKGEELLPAAFDVIGAINSNRILIVKDGKFGYSNSTGEIIIPINFDAEKNVVVTSNFINGVAIVNKQHKYFLIDTLGNPTGKIKYDELQWRNDSLLAFKLNGNWGIRKVYSEKALINATYNQFSDCAGNNCIVKSKDKSGVIDLKGTLLIPLNYESLKYVQPNLLVGKNEGKFGMIDLSNQEIIPFIYDEYRKNENGFVEFSTGDNTCWFDIEKWEVIQKKKIR